MGLLEKISDTNLGYKGNKPNFDGETPSSTLHNQSSTIGQPNITKAPSTLDEADSTNTAKYKNAVGKRYLDNLPK